MKLDFTRVIFFSFCRSAHQFCTPTTLTKLVAHQRSSISDISVNNIDMNKNVLLTLPTNCQRKTKTYIFR